MRQFLALGLLLILTSCVGMGGNPVADFRAVDFSDLPGWGDDNLSLALPALEKSCAVGGNSPKICTALKTLPRDNASARMFFETYFTPYAVYGDGDDGGLFTGYYEPIMAGSLRQYGDYQTPLYARPDDLVDVNLGLFKPDWAGQYISGKLAKGKLVPYEVRGTIVKNKLDKRARILCWVRSPIDAFFLEIQGSGIIQLDNGKILRVGYDGANGQVYVPIGRVLADRGELQKPITMQSLRAWLIANPDRAQDIMNENPSYVFFRTLNGENPVGAQGVELTPRRSLAVDRRVIKYGTPVWLDSVDGDGAKLQRLFIAQDTGGAIKGIVRGDVFWGAGDDAAHQAGMMQSPGRYFVLLPRAE